MVRCWIDDLVFYKGDIGDAYMEGFFEYVKMLLKTAGEFQYYVTVKIADDVESMCLEYDGSGFLWGVIGDRKNAQSVDEGGVTPTLMESIKDGYAYISIAKGVGF